MTPRLFAALTLVATLAACGSRPAPAASPSPETAVALGAGALLYETRFDGNDLQGPRIAGGDAAASEVRTMPGWIELRILKPRGQTAITFNTPPRRDYAGELEIVVARGSQLTLYWGLRSAAEGDLQYLLGLNTTRELMQLTLFDRSLGTQEPVSKPLPVQGLLSGRTVRLGIVLEAARTLVYLDGQEIAQKVDGRAWAPSIPTFGIVGDEGSVRIMRARFWDLP